MNHLRRVTYIEPFAGGAGAALALLISGNVEEVVINDLDPAISAFWHSIVDEPVEFARRVREVPLTVDEWLKQRETYRNPQTSNQIDLGFATFYLNRTNRSGVLDAGPIGGLDQSGNYKIDARFNKIALLERLRLISLFHNRIHVFSQDGIEIFSKYAHQPDILIYADPPYFTKGSSLYLNSFGISEHLRLASVLNECSNGNWVLTYDDVHEISSLYECRRTIRFSLNYSVFSARKAKELMVFSDALLAPESEMAWHSSN